jgi:hypothetical protein
VGGTRINVTLDSVVAIVAVNYLSGTAPHWLDLLFAAPRLSVAPISLSPDFRGIQIPGIKRYSTHGGTRWKVIA